MEGQGKPSSVELLSDEKWVVALMKHLQEPLMVFEVLRWAAAVKGPPLTKERGAVLQATPTHSFYSCSCTGIFEAEASHGRRCYASLELSGRGPHGLLSRSVLFCRTRRDGFGWGSTGKVEEESYHSPVWVVNNHHRVSLLTLV